MVVADGSHGKDSKHHDLIAKPYGNPIKLICNGGAIGKWFDNIYKRSFCVSSYVGFIVLLDLTRRLEEGETNALSEFTAFAFSWQHQHQIWYVQFDFPLDPTFVPRQALTSR